LFTELVKEARTPLATTPDVALTQARQQFFGNLSAHRHPFRLPVSSFLSQRPFPAAPSRPLPVSKRLRQQAEGCPRSLMMRFIDAIEVMS